MGKHTQQGGERRSVECMRCSCHSTLGPRTKRTLRLVAGAERPTVPTAVSSAAATLHGHATRNNAMRTTRASTTSQSGRGLPLLCLSHAGRPGRPHPHACQSLSDGSSCLRTCVTVGASPPWNLRKDDRPPRVSNWPPLVRLCSPRAFPPRCQSASCHSMREEADERRRLENDTRGASSAQRRTSAGALIQQSTLHRMHS